MFDLLYRIINPLELIREIENFHHYYTGFYNSLLQNKIPIYVFLNAIILRL